MDYLTKAAFDAIKGFAWWNYGMDEVGQTKSDEWAEALAESVVVAVLGATDQESRR